jgi:hypothetical protein
MTQAKVLFMPRLSRPSMNNKSSLSATLIVTFLMMLPPALSRNQVISRFFQAHNDEHLTEACEV